jgi:hypothetical protein
MGAGEAEAAALQSLLQPEGWSVKPEALKAAGKQPSAARDALLNLDLKKVGQPCLPSSDDIKRSGLRGPMVLQVVEARDIACPTRAAVRRL